METLPRVSRRPVVAFVAVLAAIVLFACARPNVRPGGLLRDFNAFYCAGRAVADRADPYRAEPLGTCERQPKPSALAAGVPGLAMPAPLPPYALLPFVVLSFLPYAAAGALWCAVIIAATAVAALAVARTTSLPPLAVAAAFLLADAYAGATLGQVAPIAVAAVAVAMVLLDERRDRVAAIAAAVAMIEPHVGLPACVALFVWRPKTRIVLGIAAGTCIAVSLASTGAATAFEYVARVLPAHALSEVANEKQLSLTYLLHRLGAGDAAALRAGEVWYGAMLAGGTALAGAFLRRTGDRTSLVAIPVAVALVGGPFVHIVQIAAALPAAFCLYAHASGRLRTVIGVAIVVLAIPWTQFANLGVMFAALAATVVAFLVATLVDDRPRVVAGAAAAAALFVSLLSALVVGNVPDATPQLLAHANPRDLAETSWTLYVRAVGHANALAFDLAKVPTVLGTIALTLVATALGLRRAKSSNVAAFFAQARKGAEASRRIAFR